jgi:hypothetical protein
MMKREYIFRLTSGTRWNALFCALLIAYPRVIGRYIVTSFLTPYTLFAVVFSPLLILRNALSGFFSIYPFTPELDYVLQLDEAGFAFGPVKAKAANSYSVVRDLFRVRGQHVALLHDGYLVFLPAGLEGSEVMNFIKERKAAQPSARP